MLHTKFRGNRPAGSGEDFELFLPYMGVAAILVMLPRCREKKYRSPYPRRLHIIVKFGFDWQSSFGEEDL